MFSLQSHKMATYHSKGNIRHIMNIGYFGKLSFFIVLLLSTVLYSCVEESMENIVVTEDVLYVSGDVVRLTGRVIEINGTVDDHGFQIDDNIDFSSPIILSLGSKEDGLGRFIGEQNTLNISSNYYFRSYMNVAGQESTGQINEFETLNPKLDSYSPTDGIEGNSMSIYGTNFTEDTKVKFGDQEVEIISIENDSKIIVQVPAIVDSYTTSVSVIIQDTVMTFPTSFNYHFGHWELENKFFNNLQIYEAAWLQDNDEFIVGLGSIDNYNLNNKFWKLNLLDYTWSELAYPGSDFSSSRSPFNSGLYWGSGNSSIFYDKPELSNYFWKYTNGTFEQQSSLPFKLVMSKAHYLNGELFVFGGQQDFAGQDGDVVMSLAVLRYDEALDTWELFDPSPIVITSEYPSFVHDNKAYFVQPDGNIWRYDPQAHSWNIVAQFVDTVNKGGVGVVLDGKAYIGLFQDNRKIWEWDIVNDSWLQKSSLIDTSFRDINLAAFTYNNKLFIFRSKYDGGSLVLNPRMELWSLDPNQLK